MPCHSWYFGDFDKARELNGLLAFERCKVILFLQVVQEYCEWFLGAHIILMTTLCLLSAKLVDYTSWSASFGNAFLLAGTCRWLGIWQPLHICVGLLRTRGTAIRCVWANPAALLAPTVLRDVHACPSCICCSLQAPNWAQLTGRTLPVSPPQLAFCLP